MINIENFSPVPAIYKFTCLVNNKIYIGESLNLQDRLRQHKSMNTNHYFHRAIKKYGWNNFEIDVLHEYLIPTSDLEKLNLDSELLALETAFIDFFDADNPKIGYNVLKFGFNRTGVKCSEEAKVKHAEAIRGEKNVFFGKRHTEETKQLISEKAKERYKNGAKPAMLGKCHSKETKLKISEANKGKGRSAGWYHTEETKENLSKIRIGKYTGENSPMFGKRLSEEVKQKISQANTGKIRSKETKKQISDSCKKIAKRGTENHWYGRHHSKESIEKMLKTKAENPPDYSYLRKPVRQIEKATGNVIKTWDSCEEAAKMVGVTSSHLSNVCRKQKDSSGYTYKTAKGFCWEYVNLEITEVTHDK